MRLSVVRVLSVPAVAVALLAVTLPGASAAKVRAGVITTIAGGPGGPAPGPKVAVDDPCGVTFSHGIGYFTEAGANLVRRLDPGTGLLSTVAGTGTTGLDAVLVGERKPALDAPCGTAVDAAGNVIFDDAGNDVVRVVAARNGTGDVLFADAGNRRVRVVAARTRVLFGQPMTGGDVYTVAGNGRLFYSGDGVLATRAQLNPFTPVIAGNTGGRTNADPDGLAVSPAGRNIIIADTTNHVVRVVAETTGVFYGKRLTAGHIYTVGGGSGARLANPLTAGHVYTIADEDGATSWAVAVDHAGNVVAANILDSTVTVLAVHTGRFYGQRMTAGHSYTVAGDPGSFPASGYTGDRGPAIKARLNSPSAVAVDPAGNVLVADSGNSAVRVIAERTGSFYGVKMTVGDIYTVAGGHQLYLDGTAGGFSGDGGPAVKAVLYDPCGIAVFGTGFVVLDDGNYRVRAVSGGA